MANVLKPEKQEEVRALGRLGWSLRRIQLVTGVHRDTVRDYLAAAGIAVREPRRRRAPVGLDPKPASEATADPRRGLHPEFGSVTLGQHLASWVAHDLTHITQIARAMAHRYRDAVGPWRAHLRVLGDQR